MTVIDDIFALFRNHGDSAYFGEAISQTEHALQAAYFAAQNRTENHVITAALLHDIGHLLQEQSENIADLGIDAFHQDLGASWLSTWFGPEVVEPVRLHVQAKRYLCTTEPGYFELLSAASVKSLQLQGGNLNRQELQEFEQSPYAQDAIQIRRCDEQAKVIGLVVPPLTDYYSTLEEQLIRTA